jgi:hypothetical protein
MDYKSVRFEHFPTKFGWAINREALIGNSMVYVFEVAYFTFHALFFWFVFLTKTIFYFSLCTPESRLVCIKK